MSTPLSRSDVESILESMKEDLLLEFLEAAKEKYLPKLVERAAEESLQQVLAVLEKRSSLKRLKLEEEVDVKSKKEKQIVKRVLDVSKSNIGFDANDNKFDGSPSESKKNDLSVSFSHKITPASPLAISTKDVTCSVKKLFEGRELLGAFVYIDKEVGICAFNCVARGRTVLDGSSLRVDGHVLQHMASYPYYNLSFYKVVNRSDSFAYLTLGSDKCLYEGAKIYVVGYPVLDENISSSPEEEVLITPGHITRLHSAIDFDFVTGCYEYFNGSLGAAIVTTDGRLIGMHLQNEYSLDAKYLTWNRNEPKGYPEDYSIKAPSTCVRYGKKIDLEMTRFEKADASTLANIPHQKSFGCFLSVQIIRKKFSSLKMAEMEMDCDEE